MRTCFLPHVAAVTAMIAAVTLSPAYAETPERAEKAETPVETETPVGMVTEKPAEGPFVEVDGGFMVPYTERIPGTDIAFDMVPVPGGNFLFGSPEDEEGRNDDEGPQVRVEVDPMWVGKMEVSWREYKEYMRMYAI